MLDLFIGGLIAVLLLRVFLLLWWKHRLRVPPVTEDDLWEFLRVRRTWRWLSSHKQQVLKDINTTFGR